MASPLENAEKRLALLREEIARVERFIAEYREFSATSAGEVEFPTNVVRWRGNVSQESDVLPGDKYWPERKKMRPDEIAQLIERVIREVGQPMTRGQLVEALERRDVLLPAADKARYLGTIIWRHKSIFTNIEGQGYWLRGHTIVSDKPVVFSDPSEEADDNDGMKLV